MKSLRYLLAVSFLLAGFGFSAESLWAQNIIAKARLGESDYCNLKFPAISDDTLKSSRPVLQDASSTDMVDYYGACNYDPTGKEAVNDQKPRGARQQERWG